MRSASFMQAAMLAQSSSLSCLTTDQGERRRPRRVVDADDGGSGVKEANCIIQQ